MKSSKEILERVEITHVIAALDQASERMYKECKLQCEVKLKNPNASVFNSEEVQNWLETFGFVLTCDAKNGQVILQVE